MAKFCFSCGNALNENASFCPMCGTQVPVLENQGVPASQMPASQAPASQQGYAPVQPAAQPVTYAQPAAQPVTYAQPTPVVQPVQPAYSPLDIYPGPGTTYAESLPKKKPLTWLIVVLAVVAIAIVGVIAFVLLSGSDDKDSDRKKDSDSSQTTEDKNPGAAEPEDDTSNAPYTSAMEHFCGGLAGNGEDVIACYPAEIISMVRDANGWTRTEFNEWAESYADSVRQSIESGVGANCTVEYEILDQTKLTKSELDAIHESMLKNNEIDVDVTEGYNFTAKLTYRGDDLSTTDNKALTALKIDGKWYITICREVNDDISINFF